MKASFLFFPVFVMILACNNISKMAATDQEAGKAAEIVPTQVQAGVLAQAEKELAEFESKYESRWTARPAVFPYSNSGLIRVYRLNCEGSCFKAEFRKRVSKGKIISREDLNRLLDILNDPASYNQLTAACFDPKFGLVVYDEEGVPMEFLSICMGCNNFRTFPGVIRVAYEKEGIYGFSRDARERLRQLFLEWGIDYYGFSPLWDDESAYSEYLDRNKEKAAGEKNKK